MNNKLEIDFDNDVFNMLAESMDDVFPELLSVFFQETELALDEMKGFIDQEDWVSVAETAHKLKSSAKTFGALSLTNVLVSIETLSLDQSNIKINKAEIDFKYDDLLKEFKNTKEYIIQKS